MGLNNFSLTQNWHHIYHWRYFVQQVCCLVSLKLNLWKHFAIWPCGVKYNIVQKLYSSQFRMCILKWQYSPVQYDSYQILDNTSLFVTTKWNWSVIINTFHLLKTLLLPSYGIMLYFNGPKGFVNFFGSNIRDMIERRGKISKSNFYVQRS